MSFAREKTTERTGEGRGAGGGGDSLNHWTRAVGRQARDDRSKLRRSFSLFFSRLFQRVFGDLLGVCFAMVFSGVSLWRW